MATINLALTPVEYLNVLANRAGVEIDTQLVNAFINQYDKMSGIIDIPCKAAGFYTKEKLNDMQNAYNLFFKIFYSVDAYLFAPHTPLANDSLLETEANGITDIIVGNVPLMLAHLDEIIANYHSETEEDEGPVTTASPIVRNIEKLNNAAIMLIPMLKLLSVSAKMTRYQGTDDEDEWITKDCFDGLKYFVFGRGYDGEPNLPKVTKMF